MKKSIIIIIVAVSLVILVAGGYRLYMYLTYARVLQNDRELWLSEDFIPSQIEGVVYEFNAPSGKDCFSKFIVKKNDGEKFSSGVCLCENEAFINYVSVGDSIIKPSGSTKILIIKINGRQKEFDFPFCEN